MNGLFSLCGYDVSLIDRVGAGERRFFVGSALLSVTAALLAGCGMGYGCVLTVGVVPSPVAAVVAAAFVMNLLRLQHAGSGYPLHLPIEEIHHWRPATAGVVVLFVFGVLIVQPLVFLVERPWIDPVLEARAAEQALVRAGLGLNSLGISDAGFGLIARGRAAYSELFALSISLTVLFALCVAGPALLRVLGASVLRHYESERWITERIVVDDEWAWARDCIEHTLMALTPASSSVPTREHETKGSGQRSWPGGFTPPLQVPFADPPYNTRPLVFGIDPAVMVPGRVRFTRVSRKKTAPTPAIPAPETPWWAGITLSGSPLPDLLPPPVTAASGPAVTSQETGPSPPAPLLGATTRPATATATAATTTMTTAMATPTMAPTPMTTTTATATATTAMATTAATPTMAPTTATAAALSVVDVSSMLAKDARDHVRAMAVCARYLNLSPAEVLASLRAADDDVPVRAVFPAWNKLDTIITHRADVALVLGLAPVVAVVVGRDAETVERRLRAVPGEARLDAIFAPELARRLLRQRP